MTQLLINNVVESIWKEPVMADFKILSQHLPGEIEENHEKPVRIACLRAKI
jgi:hypothetical protein